MVERNVAEDFVWGEGSYILPLYQNCATRLNFYDSSHGKLCNVFQLAMEIHLKKLLERFLTPYSCFTYPLDSHLTAFCSWSIFALSVVF